MLVFTGFRLAAPQEFVHIYHVGREQFIIFVSTVVGVLATDLLIGIAIGICVNVGLHLKNGAPARSLFTSQVRVDREDPEEVTLMVKDSAIFSTWIGLKKQLEKFNHKPRVVLDLSETFLVDHTTMAKLHEMEKEFQETHSTLVITGLEQHRPFSDHPEAGRKKPRE